MRRDKRPAAATASSIVALLVVLKQAHAQPTSSAEQDAGVLLNLLSGTQDSLQFDSWNEKNIKNVCKWERVSCTSGRVSTLDLSGLGMKGSVPEGISNLALLQTLDLSDNSLTGALPDSWGEAQASPFQNLRVLDMSNNQLSGSLPTAWGKAMAFPALMELNLLGNKFTGSLPSTWAGRDIMRNVQSLDLSHNSISGSLPANWGYAPDAWRSLINATLANNNITGDLPRDWAGGFPNLQTLDLGENDFSGRLPASWAGGFDNLRILGLQGNAFQGAAPKEWSGNQVFKAMAWQDGAGIILLPNDGLCGPVPSSVKVLEGSFDNFDTFEGKNLNDRDCSDSSEGTSQGPSEGPSQGPAKTPAEAPEPSQGPSQGPFQGPSKTPAPAQAPTTGSTSALADKSATSLQFSFALMGSDLSGWGIREEATLRMVIEGIAQDVDSEAVVTLGNFAENGQRRRLLQNGDVVSGTVFVTPSSLVLLPDIQAALQDSIENDGLVKQLNDKGISVDSVQYISSSPLPTSKVSEQAQAPAVLLPPARAPAPAPRATPPSNPPSKSVAPTPVPAPGPGSDDIYTLYDDSPAPAPAPAPKNPSPSPKAPPPSPQIPSPSPLNPSPKLPSPSPAQPSPKVPSPSPKAPAPSPQRAPSPVRAPAPAPEDYEYIIDEPVEAPEPARAPTPAKTPAKAPAPAPVPAMAPVVAPEPIRAPAPAPAEAGGPVDTGNASLVLSGTDLLPWKPEYADGVAKSVTDFLQKRLGIFDNQQLRADVTDTKEFNTSSKADSIAGRRRKLLQQLPQSDQQQQAIQQPQQGPQGAQGAPQQTNSNGLPGAGAAVMLNLTVPQYQLEAALGNLKGSTTDGQLLASLKQNGVPADSVQWGEELLPQLTPYIVTEGPSEGPSEAPGPVEGPAPSPSESSSSSVPVGAIIGAILGAVLLAVLVALLGCFLLRKRKASKAGPTGMMGVKSGSGSEVTPPVNVNVEAGLDGLTDSGGLPARAALGASIGTVSGSAAGSKKKLVGKKDEKAQEQLPPESPTMSYDTYRRVKLGGSKDQPEDSAAFTMPAGFPMDVGAARNSTTPRSNSRNARAVQPTQPTPHAGPPSSPRRGPGWPFTPSSPVTGATNVQQKPADDGFSFPALSPTHPDRHTALISPKGSPLPSPMGSPSYSSNSRRPIGPIV